MRKLIFILIICPLFSWAQTTPADTVSKVSPILKFSPLSLIDLTPSAQFAIEYKIAKKISLQHELGYITYYYFLHHDEESNINDRNRTLGRSGIRLRSEMRFYLNPEGDKLVDLYVAPELVYINFKEKRVNGFGEECDDFGNCAFFRLAEYNRKKEVYALHLKIGAQEIIFDRFTFEGYAGFGYRKVIITEADKPTTASFGFGNIFDRDPGSYTMPSLSLGFKVGYLIFDPIKL